MRFFEDSPIQNILRVRGCISFLLLVANLHPSFFYQRKKRRFLREHCGATALPPAPGSHCWLPEVQSSLLVTNSEKEQMIYESHKATVILQNKIGTGY